MIKEKRGTSDTYISPKHVRLAIDLEKDPARKADLQFFYDHFGDIDKKKGQRHGVDKNANGTDGRIGAGDVEEYFGWSGDPKNSGGSNNTQSLTYDSSKVKLLDVFGGPNGMVNYIKEKSGTIDTYISPAHVRMVADMEKDPDKKLSWNTSTAILGMLTRRRGNDTVLMSMPMVQTA
jgi:hypothetical protein